MEPLKLTVNKIIAERKLPQLLSKEAIDVGLKRLDEMLKSENVSFADLAFLLQAREEVISFYRQGYNIAKCSVLLPAGTWGLTSGFSAPDLDITLLGIGNHRFFLFHSALGLVTLRYMYKRWLASSSDSTRFLPQASRKLSGAVLGAYAMGVGIHLAVDVFQPKSIVFPFFGSLANGTLVDDNIWLLGNSIWAFRIGKEMFALTLADELDAAKAFVKGCFSPLKKSWEFNCDFI